MEFRASSVDVARRHLLKLGLAGVCATAALPARASLYSGAPRKLALENLHTGERTSLIYWEDGGYVQEALVEIDHLLRDFRTGETARMDRGLYDLLHVLGEKLNTDAPFQVISGYRSPRTNRALAAKGRGVARGSLHQFGRAIDVRIPGVRLGDLRKAARALRLGGVGYYPRSNFVHVDTGRVRFW